MAENIAYARPDASREEIEAAARRAQAHEFVERLPQGYDTRVGERGLTLSGGQRQRLAIARALLANPRVLILDDATSSVDASTEQSIKLALAEAMAGRTTFVIAHRLSTIALADEIVVLDHGRIVAQGNHHELLQVSELYREIVEKGLPEQRVHDKGDTRARGERPMSPRRRDRSEQPASGDGRAASGALEARAMRRRAMGRGGSAVGRRARRRGTRGRNLRGLIALLRPYRARGRDHAGGAAAGHRRLAGAAAAGQGGDRPRHREARHDTLVLVVVAFLARRCWCG